MNTDTHTVIEKLTQDILHQCGIEATIQVSAEEEAIVVHIETQDAGILIGAHGRTILSLQALLSQMMHKQTGQWLHIIVDVGDWRARREEQLHELADDLAQEALETGSDIQAPPLSSFERRIIHMALSDSPDVVSESVGQGRDRRLVIRKRA